MPDGVMQKVSDDMVVAVAVNTKAEANRIAQFRACIYSPSPKDDGHAGGHLMLMNMPLGLSQHS